MGPVTVGTGHDGAVYAAARSAAVPERDARGRWHTTLESPIDYLLLRADGVEIRKTILKDERLPVSFVQPFGADGFLVAGARCSWRPGDIEKNAAVVDAAGHARSRMTLGDGLADLRVGADGTIWASYFDEGVFGNYGWGVPGPAPMGASGLVAFDAGGNVKLAFDNEAAHTDIICDAYALNLCADGAVWVYFYTDFPIVTIKDGVYRSWTLGVSGARAMATDGWRVLLFGRVGKSNAKRWSKQGARPSRARRSLGR